MIISWALIFWLSLAVIAYTYAGYPLIMAALARLLPRPWLRAPWPAGAPPITVVMAVHNGAPMLPAQLAHLLTLDRTLVEKVIVVSDGSTDATNAILSATEHPRLHPILLPVQVGKSAAVNQGIAAATSQILLFVDIRPRIEPGALAALLTNFADPAVGCVAGELLLSTAGHDGAASAVSGLYWRYEQWIRNCEAAVDSPTGVYGGFYAIRRALATPAPQGLILDDMFQPLSIVRKGYRSVLERSAFVTDTWPASSAGEFSRKVRTLAGNLQLIAENPWLLTPANRVLFQLVSHKLLRLAVPWFFALLLLSSIALGLRSLPYMLFAIAQLALWTIALVSLRIRLPLLHRIAAPAGALLVLNAAAVMGLYKFLFTHGPLWKIWSPTARPLRKNEQMIDQRSVPVSDFDTWFENVVSEANLIASPQTLTRVWLHGEKALTSAYDVEELLEQLLGDLNLSEQLVRFEDELRRLGALETIVPFVTSLIQLEENIRSDSRLLNPETLLVSSPWIRVVKSAESFLLSSATQEYSLGRPTTGIANSHP